MRTHVDWLTFTLSPIWISNIPEGGFEDAYINSLMDGIIHQFGEEAAIKAFGGGWEKAPKSRAPYTDSWRIAENGITIFSSPSLSHFCIEVSGAGCERLLRLNILGAILSSVHERVTRIDVATDIETGIPPSEFTFYVNHDRMRASGYQKSETGETCYVGSQKSDRYARVYRYNPPHPRSHLLRVEHVFRRDYAKKVAKTASESDIHTIALAAGLAFGWGHPLWRAEGADNLPDISITQGGREAGRTVFWLVNSAGPAFKRLCENGSIRNPQAFLEQYFLSGKSMSG